MGNPLIKSAILVVVRKIAKNHLPPGVAKYLIASFLIILLKPNGSDRPISIRDFFVRLTGGALLYNICHTIPKYTGGW